MSNHRALDLRNTADIKIARGCVVFIDVLGDCVGGVFETDWKPVCRDRGGDGGDLIGDERGGLQHLKD